MAKLISKLVELLDVRFLGSLVLLYISWMIWVSGALYSQRQDIAVIRQILHDRLTAKQHDESNNKRLFAKDF